MRSLRSGEKVCQSPRAVTEPLALKLCHIAPRSLAQSGPSWATGQPARAIQASRDIEAGRHRVEDVPVHVPILDRQRSPERVEQERAAVVFPAEIKLGAHFARLGHALSA